MLRRLRWVAIFASLALVVSVVEAAAGDIALATYVAVVGVFFLVADIAAR